MERFRVTLTEFPEDGWTYDVIAGTHTEAMELAIEACPFAVRIAHNPKEEKR